MTDWRLRFLDLAAHVASWSKDPSTKTGAVIIRPDRTVASVGYNGFPRQMGDWDARYRDREEKYSRIVHAEVNALVHCREPVQGYTVYIYPFMPCDRCFVQLAQAGIAQIVAPVAQGAARERWEPVFVKVRGYAMECGIPITELVYTPPYAFL